MALKVVNLGLAGQAVLLCHGNFAAEERMIDGGTDVVVSCPDYFHLRWAQKMWSGNEITDVGGLTDEQIDRQVGTFRHSPGYMNTTKNVQSFQICKTPSKQLQRFIAARERRYLADKSPGVSKQKCPTGS